MPIESDVNDVHFLVGPTEELMKDVSFDEGRIVELNNQAKHAVSNDMTTGKETVYNRP